MVTPPYSPPNLCPSPSSSASSPSSSYGVDTQPPPQVLAPPQDSLTSQASAVSPQSKPAPQQVSTGPLNSLCPSKQQQQQPPPLTLSPGLDTGAQLASLCSQISLPHFNGMYGVGVTMGTCDTRFSGLSNSVQVHTYYVSHLNILPLQVHYRF